MQALPKSPLLRLGSANCCSVLSEVLEPMVVPDLDHGTIRLETLC